LHSTTRYSNTNTKKDRQTKRQAISRAYIKNINKYEINFGIGDAGTGKTYIAVAAAVEAFLSDKGSAHSI